MSILFFIKSHRGLEFTYWLSTFEAMTKQSTLLTGFAFARLAGAVGAEERYVSMIYLAVTSISMGFGLLVITASTMVSVRES